MQKCEVRYLIYVTNKNLSVVGGYIEYWDTQKYICLTLCYGCVGTNENLPAANTLRWEPFPIFFCSAAVFGGNGINR